MTSARSQTIIKIARVGLGTTNFTKMQITQDSFNISSHKFHKKAKDKHISIFQKPLEISCDYKG